MIDLADTRTRGSFETEFSRAIVRFEKEFVGRGPLEARTYIVDDDMVLVRLKGVLTQAERKLSEAQSDRSSYLLKQVRSELLASGRQALEGIIYEQLRRKVQSVHTDISTKTGERVILITLCPSEPVDRLKAEDGGIVGL